MPAKTTLFDTKANASHNFALGPRNTILFSPHGRFVLVAGFGNLAGQMDIYDMEKDYQKLCTIEASNASVCEWSPDGRHILTATTSPRLRVDNGVKIWHVGGDLMFTEELEELYHVTWRPQSSSSNPLENPLHPVPAPHASALKYLGSVKTPSKSAGAYRPPGARGQLTPLAFKREDQGGAAYVSNGSLSLALGANGFGKPRKREVPGSQIVTGDSQGAALAVAADGDENLSKAAAKNKKKREARKAKDAAGIGPIVDGAAPDTTINQSRSPERKGKRGHERYRSKSQLSQLERRPQSLQDKREQGQPQPEPRNPGRQAPPDSAANGTNVKVPPEAPGLSVTPAGGGGTAQDKKVRALLKKLRAIDDLKMRRAGGEKLEGTQIKKMDTEDEVRKELGGLGWNE